MIESEGTQAIWSESESQRFLELGRLYTPRRDDILAAFLDLIPFDKDEAFTGVELGTGSGWLIEGILAHFPAARMTGLDGSDAMRASTGTLLARFGERGQVAPFRLEEMDWREELPAALGLVVSSLVIHHLDGPGKAALFADLFSRLQPRGALLICDVIQPANEAGRRHMAAAWDEEVRRNSLTARGDLSVYEHFVSDEWNIYAYPVPEDDIDHPSTLVEQLDWLRQAGFTGVDCWWARAGHAIFGGYKPE